MKLRFAVNQAEALRRGIDCPRSTATVEVDPAKLTPEQRNLIADRLVGIDVCELLVSDEGIHKAVTHVPWEDGQSGKRPKPIHVEANGPTFEDLMKAIELDQKELEDEQACRLDAPKRKRLVAMDIGAMIVTEQAASTSQ